ncbi:insulinase family protein [Pacificimonas sp. WHA3]|uniref:Insulinase family protein n=1 Tax=Pacificimonas pallii TaxID=2827236 RepID=A0ABS6SFX3_9SPHN|nr:pitrilysin family protein [Pacificimonas pallii]MBV7257315.1 insulinase family protein [Pacificimonas pallii]
MQRLSTLSNGLRVVTREMPSVETVAVAVHSDVGSRHEKARENGLAHLFEHMLFKGAGGRSARQLAETIEDVGGDMNAMTGREGTVFSARLLAGDLPHGLSVIADMIRHPHFDPDELEREKQVVLQELGEVRDNAGDLIFDDLQEAAFPGQALGRSILGDETSISGLTRDDLTGWADRHYRPKSMLVVAAGKLSHDDVMAEAEARFGDMEGGTLPLSETARFHCGGMHRDRPTEQAHLTLGFAGPAVKAADLFAARLFGEAVGGGMSSRLFQELREERGLAYSVYASHAPFADGGLFTCYAATPRSEAEAALALMREVLAGAARDLEQAELDRARALAKSGLLMALESCEGQAGYVARQVLVHGRTVEPQDVVAQIDALTLDEVRAAGAAMLAGAPAMATIGAGKLKAAA